MNKQQASLIATLLIFSSGVVSAPAVNDKAAEPQETQAESAPASATNDNHKVSEKTETLKAPAVTKPVEPITGAFGIQLGEKFETSMVAKVLSEQEQTYKGPDGTKLKGQLLRVEPGKPEKRFQQYSIKTTETGFIYSIQGDYQYDVKQGDAGVDEAKPEGSGKGAGKPGNKKPASTIQKTCKAAVKTMAGELEALYGKPRGQGWDGLWFTFRQFSDTSNRGLKLYGHRCRSGMYSIIYTDEKVQNN